MDIGRIHDDEFGIQRLVPDRDDRHENTVNGNPFVQQVREIARQIIHPHRDGSSFDLEIQQERVGTARARLADTTQNALQTCTTIEALAILQLLESADGRIRQLAMSDQRHLLRIDSGIDHERRDVPLHFDDIAGGECFATHQRAAGTLRNIAGEVRSASIRIRRVGDHAREMHP